MQYDDMDGLEYGDLGGFIDMEMLKDTLVAGIAGGGALMLTSYVNNMLVEKVDFLQRDDENMQKVQTGAVQVVVGLVAGRAMLDYSREAAMGIIGGLAAVGVANIVNGFLKDKAIPFSGMDDESLLSDYGDGMEALAALETTGVTTAPGAFQGLGDPTVTPEALMGTVVQQETLGGYAPYLS